MYESNNTYLDDMSCTLSAWHVACDLHNFLNFTWQIVDVRKARKMVMESEIV